MAIIALPFPCWVGLAVAGTEVVGNGYVRVPAVFDYCEDGITVANDATVQWTMATGSWGVIDTIQIWNVAQSGDPAIDLLGSLPIAEPLQVSLYDRPRISAGDIVVTIASRGSPYGTLTFGIGRYATTQYFASAQHVPLELTFDAVALCGGQPGDWTQGPFGVTA